MYYIKLFVLFPIMFCAILGVMLLIGLIEVIKQEYLIIDKGRY